VRLASPLASTWICLFLDFLADMDSLAEQPSAIAQATRHDVKCNLCIMASCSISGASSSYIHTDTVRGQWFVGECLLRAIVPTRVPEGDDGLSEVYAPDARAGAP